MSSSRNWHLMLRSTDHRSWNHRLPRGPGRLLSGL